LSTFPAPGAGLDGLLESFLLAALTPVLVSLSARVFRRPRAHFDFARLNAAIQNLDD
jgi:hypothetical protein